MSSTITQFNTSGALTWSESITGFTGLQVTDNMGNIFALTSSSIRKYSSDSTFIASFDFYFTPNDITYGYDNHVYLCGEDNGSGSGSGSGTSDGYIIRLTTDLVEVASVTISADPVQQIKADVYGNSYVSCDSFSIRKFSPFLIEFWESDFFTSVPKIAITKNGNIYAAGQVESGGWVEAFDNSYWALYGYWDGEKWIDHGGGLSLNITYGATWPEDYRPTYIKVYGKKHVGATIDNASIRLASGTYFDLTYITDGTDFTLTYDGADFWYVEKAIDWTIEPSKDICRLDLYDFLEVHNIEFYSGVETNGFAAISSDGEVTGFIPRATTVQQILIDNSGNLLVKEDNTTISMIEPTTGNDIWTYDTGLQINTLITGIYGDVDTNSLAARMTFSSDVILDGTAQEAYVVYPISKITFDQPTPGIDGHQVNIYPDPGQITFQSNANLMTVIAVTPGAISLSGNAEVIVPVIPVGNEINFSGELTNTDILGDLTILKPTGQLQFGTHPETWIFTSDAPGYGPIILIDPPTISFASNYIDINQQTVYVSPGKFSFSSNAFHLSDVTVTVYVSPGEFLFSSNAFHLSSEDVLATGTVEFPSLELDLYAGAFLESEFPVFEMTGNGNAGHAGRLFFVLPSLSVELNTGGQLEEDFPRLSLEMTAINNVLAVISDTLPQLNAYLTASHPSTADLDITLPMFSMALEATIGIVGSISARLPKFSLGITALPGATADLKGTFKLLKLTATGEPSGPGEINATFPMFDFKLISGERISGELVSVVLRYDWERVR